MIDTGKLVDDIVLAVTDAIDDGWLPNIVEINEPDDDDRFEIIDGDGNIYCVAVSLKQPIEAQLAVSALQREHP